MRWLRNRALHLTGAKMRSVHGWHRVVDCTLSIEEIARRAICHLCGAPAVFHDANAYGTATHAWRCEAWRCEACFVVIALASD